MLLTEMVKLLGQIESLLTQTQEGREKLDALWKKFGLAVREARDQRRMSLEELAAKMGVKKSQLSYLENGQRSWNLEAAMKAIEGLKRS